VPAHEGPRWDYCQSTTRHGCQCAAPWWYEHGDSGYTQRYDGTCGNPDDDPGGDWCFIVEGSCDDAHHWDYCGPQEPRRTIGGGTCTLPFVFKGVTYHDCAVTEDSRGWCDATD